ncbi:uncharacterized protein il17rb isoform X2 [Echeneis naucrates]|nr:interleukin-17 receptor B isoform X2 [Echeneis naucrates]
MMVNVSWAVNIDASIGHLMGTLISMEGSEPYHCIYNPHLSTVNVTGSKKWFHHLFKVRFGSCFVSATNIPLPPQGSGTSYIYESINIRRPPSTTPVTTQYTQTPTEFTSVVTTTSYLRAESVTSLVFAGLTGLMILSSCYIFYKSCAANIAKSFGFKKLPQSAMAPVPVLIVYPAETPAFQQAVVALAEFLLCHGGCNVAIGMWQQGKIAELGPIRWLAEQVKVAERVLIVCPQPSLSKVNCSFSEPYISAASQDLYPLILNMVAGHAKSASDLARFWVVQLAEQQVKGPCNLPLELRACRTFCLMNDLKKLCKSLHAHRKNGKKISEVIAQLEISYSEKSTLKLTEAVKKHFQRVETSETVVRLV